MRLIVNVIVPFGGVSKGDCFSNIDLVNDMALGDGKKFAAGIRRVAMLVGIILVIGRWLALIVWFGIDDCAGCHLC